jgi:putative nucleotidyltransferase with HDIG domain
MQGKETTLFIFEAEEGMTLAKDAIGPDGHLLIQSGTKLTQETINTIADNHILEISVYKDDGDAAPAKAAPAAAPAAPSSSTAAPAKASEPNYFEKIQASPEFKKFSAEYNKTVSNLKGSLNDVVTKNKEVDANAITHDTETILSGSRTNLQVFDMLHCLRKNDDLTFVHCVNVSLIASIIGRWLKMSDEDLHVLMVAGLLHDVGKLLIPDEILLKPGKLTDEEFATMKTHVNLGYDKIKDQNLDTRIKEACLLHHEKCDGTGYPFQLKGDNIPLFAKIITIADVYDAMTAARVYRGSMCPFDVIRIMEEDSFTKYDPNILIPFLNNVVSSYLHNNVRLSNGQEGEVILINTNRLSRPSILCKNGDFIDLSKRADLTIEMIL